jgi:hypothetical protein
MLPIRYLACAVLPLAAACVWKAGGPEIATPRVDGSIVSASQPPPAEPVRPVREAPARIEGAVRAADVGAAKAAQ